MNNSHDRPGKEGNETNEWYDARKRYAEWRKQLIDATYALTEDKQFMDNTEDLGDFVEMIGTLMSFSPYPGPGLET